MREINKNFGLPRFTRQIIGGYSRIKTGTPPPFVIGKAEKPLIIRKLIRAPHYIPSKVVKHVESYAKEVIKHPKQYSKATVTFAKATLKPSEAIKSAQAQRLYTKGGVETLAATGDIKDIYNATHNTESMAGDTLRAITKEQVRPSEPTWAQKRVAAGIQPRRELGRPYDRPWRTNPISHGAVVPVAPAAHELHHLGSMSSGALQFGNTHLPSHYTGHHEQMSVDPGTTILPEPIVPSELPTAPAPTIVESTPEPTRIAA